MYVGIEKKEKGRNRGIKTRIKKRSKTKSGNNLHPTREILSCIQLVGRLRAVPLFSLSIEQNARDTQMTTAWLKARERLRHLTLARACNSLTKSEEKERLLAV